MRTPGAPAICRNRPEPGPFAATDPAGVGAVCPSCGGLALAPIYRLASIPAQSVILFDTPEAARDMPRGQLDLRFCDDCGFVFNSAFDAAGVDYASTTEESQHFSGTFNAFARTLVEEIARRYDLAGRLTLEIGCGKGDFLQELVAQTGTIGLGVDPGFIPDRLPGAHGRDITFRREYFDPAAIETPPGFVVCRHTLEHIPDVGRFLADIATVLSGRRDVGILFETPDMARVLAEGAFWDIYHEHCSYFTLGSHARLFRRAGLHVTRTYLAYGDQYIVQYAEPGAGTPLPEENDLDRVRALAAAFPAKVAAVRAHWTDFVRDRHGAGGRIAIWGGGSKCVSFITSNDLADAVEQVIDINPFKQGKYLPGTGHRVSPPDDLVRTRPDTVIVMNPVYLPEVAARLAALGLSPDLVAL